MHDEDGSVNFSDFYHNVTKRVRTSGPAYSRYVATPQILIQNIIRGSDKVRYQVCWRGAHQRFPDLLTDAYKHSGEIPAYIRAIQGHSGATRLDLTKMTAWEVTEEHADVLFHAGWRHNIDSILRNGLLAGGATEQSGRRQHCYFSIRDPRHAARGQERPVTSGVTQRPYPIHDKFINALYQINLRRARELGLRFYQTPSLAVLCDENIPPECILKITDMHDQVLYMNKLLSDWASGDRPAYSDQGSAFSNAILNYNLFNYHGEIQFENIDTRPETDAIFMKQYCCRFHDERICNKCGTFNIKGLVYCVKCGAAEPQEPSMASILISAQDQLAFTYAELRPLIFKANYQYRGKVTGEAAILRGRAKKHLQRAQRGTLQSDGILRSFSSIVERWDYDDIYRASCIKEGLSREDAVRYDYIALQPPQKSKDAI